jgi:solute carrier family 25 phosphate transporter 3
MASTTPPSPSTGLVLQQAAVPTKAPERPTGLALYSRFAFAGAVCCAVTHGALTPVDV